MNEKNELRKKCLNERNKLNQNTIKIKSNEILNNLSQLEQYKNAEKIFTYINMGSEVITSTIINDALNKNKIVGVPVAIPKSRDMHFIEIKSLDNLTKSNFGCLEPVLNEDLIVESDSKTLILVPGAAFSKTKFRIGYGGGYYDTYLSSHNYYYSIGLAFDIQVKENVYEEMHDKTVDLIITEKGVF